MSSIFNSKSTDFKTSSSVANKNRVKKARRILGEVLFYLMVLLVVFVIIAPFLWMLISSVSPQIELVAKPPHWIPENITFKRYLALFGQVEPGQSVPAAADKFLGAFKSSLVVSSATMLICMVAGTLSAYAFARLNIPGRSRFLIGILAAQMIPLIVIIIPLYLLMQSLDLMDKWSGLTLLYAGFMLPTVIWIMDSYFQTIPRQLEEAAMIDGCSRLGALWRVIIPLTGPGLVSIASFTFLSAWNEFFMALIFTGSHAKTITVIVTEFTTQFGIDFGLMATGGVIGSIPPLILAFLLQNYIVQGLTAGSVKG